MTDPSKVIAPAPIPVNEIERLAALRRYNILDTPPEAAFDRITLLAARLFEMPTVLVSLLDESRAWFKSCYGFDQQQVHRDASICSFAVLSDDVLVVPDTQQDVRFACNQFVQNEPGLRFYAGAPLLTSDGFNLGTLCLLDSKPRNSLTSEQQATLADLAAMVVDELELRLAARKIAHIDEALLTVSQGVSGATGEAFFSALVQHLAKTLGIDYTYIGLLKGNNAEFVKTIAACAQGQIIDNFEYLLQGTPCQEVIRQRKLCCYPSGVQSLFPNAPLLSPLNVESYVVIPFFDSRGTALGLLGVMGQKPLENVQLAESLLRIFALRIATELERQQTELSRQQVQSDLERLVKQRTVELSKTNELLHLEITERQQAEAALKQKQEFLKVLLDNVQAGIVACNAEGFLTLFNQAARKFHGLPEQPLPPEQWAERYNLYMSDGKTPMPKAEIPLFRALQEQVVDNVEMVIVPKAKSKARTLLASGQAIIDTQGKKQGAVVVMHDITERKQAETELLISDTTLEQMPDAILLTDLEGKIQRWLGNSEQIFGYKAAEVIGKPVSFLHAPGIKATMTTQIIQSLQETGAFYGEISCQRKDGTAVPIETTAKTVYDKAGNPLFFIGINKDITERKQAEAERVELVREQTARLEAEADQQRATFLVEVTTVLASSLEYERTLTSVANLVIPFLADWCVVDILEANQFIHRVAVSHSDPEKVSLGWELHQRYPTQLNDAEGISKVLRIGQTEIVTEISDAALAASAQDAEHLQILCELGLKSYIISPLITRGQILGTITLVTAESNRHYTKVDLALVEAVAHRAAISIDNARLYQEAQQAQQAAEQSAARVARLQSVTAALSGSLTPTKVSQVIVEQGIAALDASFALVALLNETSTELEIVQAVGCKIDQLNGWQKFSLDAPVPLAEVVRTRQPLWAESSEERAVRYPHLAEKYEQQDFGCWISLPLIVEGRALGGISFGFTEPQLLEDEDRAFILSLAQQCAQAISRTQLYQAEQTARSYAEAANRVKDEFLAVLSHELRTPLNPILGWIRLLRTGKLNVEKIAYALETIERNAKLQTQLIEDLLDVSRILQGKLTLNVYPVDLAATIAAAQETVRLAAEAKTIEIQTVFAPNVGQILGDFNRLQQVVWNLLANAVKFTPTGGRIEVRLDSIDFAARIQIKDTGIGIEPDFLPYVFNYFRQADGAITRKFGGLGLGLAIARQIVELHGGTIAVDSAGVGQGTTFTVLIPLAPQSSAMPPLKQSSEPTFDLSGMKILVVDDEADSRELISFVLEQEKALVTAASSGIEALQVMERSIPDLLISDIGMPEMDGYMLMRQIRTMPQSNQILAIALTAYAGEIDRQQAEAAGFQLHLSKPVEPIQLLEAISNLIKGNQ